MMPLCEIVWTLILALMVCDCGERVINGFNELYDRICQFNWNSYPIRIQRMLPTIMNFGQQPVVLQGFSFSCRREVFQKVRNIAGKLQNHISYG